MVTSTGVGFRSGTTRTWITLPMVTPSSVTGAPSFTPAAFSKYTRSASLRANSPPLELDMRRISPTSTAMAAITNAPTLSCDH